MANEPDLLIEAGFSDAKLAAEVKKLTDKYREAGKAAEKAFKDSTGAVGDNQKVQAHMRELDKLQKAYDPVYTATQKYEAAIKKLDRALQVGAVDQAKYTAEVKRAQVELGKVSGVVGAAGDLPQKSRLAGHEIQNLGYQVQDFAVQVAGGTSATRAFSQQFPQMASVFGPWGTMIGTAAAILVPLGAALLTTGNSAADVEKQIDGLTKSTDAMVAATEAAATPIEDLRSRFGDLADEILRASQAQSTFATVMAQRNLTGTAKSLATTFGGLSTTPVGDMLSGIASDYENTLRALRRELKGNDEAAMALIKGLSALEDIKGPEDMVRAIDDIQGALADAAIGGVELSKEMKGFFDATTAVGKEAQRQIGALSADQDAVIQKYQTHTDKFRELARDRAVAQSLVDDAVKSGSKEAIKLANERLRMIDREIDKTRELARESDVAFAGMARAYREYAQSRAEGAAWASSPQGFEAKYVADRASGAGSADEELVRSVAALAEQMGIAAKDLLAVMSFETGGKLRPDVMGPTTKNGRHFGLIQFGDKGAGPRYGVTPGSSITEQVVATGRYLQDAGVKAGDSLANIYAAVLAGDARKVNASDLAAGGVVGNVTTATSGEQFAPHLARAEGLLAAYGGAIKEVNDASAEQTRQLQKEVQERERQLDVAKQLGAQLASNLLSTQQSAELEARRVAGMQAIVSSGVTGDARASAEAQLNAELERQETIWKLLADAKRRNVDVDGLVDASQQQVLAGLLGLQAGTITYRQAIDALGEAQAVRIVTDQRAAAETERLAEAQAFAEQQQRRLEDGLLDAIVAGESFSDVLADVAKSLARAALEAALFGRGPMAGGGAGGGLLGNLFGSLFGGFRAAGGPVSAGSAYMVGERGPELIIPRAAGTVIPNHALGAGSGAGMNINISLAGANGDEAVARIAQASVLQGLASYDQSLPGRVQQIRRDPRAR